MSGFITGFRKFIARGNLMDLAIGVMVGGAFSSLVKSFVDDILSPLVGIFLGHSKMESWSFKFEVPGISEAGASKPVILSYGKFIQTSIDFIILAFVIYCLFKVVTKVREKAEDPKDTSVPTPKDIELLTEIRDALTTKQAPKS